MVVKSPFKKKQSANNNKLPNCGGNFKTCIFLCCRKPRSSDGSILFSKHPCHNSPLSAFPLLVLLLLLFEQLVDLPLGHGGVLCDDAVLVHTRQKQQKAHCGKEEGARWHQLPLSNASKPHPPTQELRYSDILFLVAPERLSHDGAPNYSCKHKLVKSGFRVRTSSFLSSHVETKVEAVHAPPYEPYGS